MPIFVTNASQDPGSLGASLKTLGESMFGNQALHEVQRQTAQKLGRENSGREAAANAYRSGNMIELGAQGLRGDVSGQDINQYGVRRAVDTSNGDINNPNLNVNLLGVGHAAPLATAQNTAQTEAGAMARTQAQETGAMAREQAKPVSALDQNGNLVYSTQGGVTAPGSTFRPVPTVDQQLYLMDQPGGAKAGPTPQPAPASVPYTDNTGQPSADAAPQPNAQPAQQASPQPQQRQIPPVIQAMIDGRMPPPTGTALRSPQTLLLLKQAAQYDPSFDLTQWDARHKQAADIATNGNAGKMLLAYNQLLPHLRTASDLALALQNGDNRAVNTLTNAWRSFTGDPRPVTFDTVREVAALDAARLLRGSGQMAEQDIEHWRQMISTANSPQQLQSVLGTLGIDLMDARRASIQGQYKSIMGKDLPEGMILPEAMQARDVLASRRPQFNAPGAQPQKPQTVIQNGHTYTLQPDGSYK